MNSFKLLLLFLIISTSTTAQEIPNPEFTMRPYFITDGQLENFEKVKAQIDIKVKGMGYGGSETYLTAFNEESSIKFESNKIPKIIIKIEGDEDPEDYISILKSTKKKKLIKFNKKKKKEGRRRFKVASRAMGGKVRDVSNSEITFVIKKIKGNIYEIIIDTELETGEYAIIPIQQSNGNPLLSYNSTQKIYCFGIK